MRSEKDKKIEQLSNLWLANNMDYEGLQKVLCGLDPTWKQRQKDKEVDWEDDKKEWNRLKAFMGGRK